MVRMRFKYSCSQDRWNLTACGRPEASHRAMIAGDWLVSFQGFTYLPKELCACVCLRKHMGDLAQTEHPRSACN